MGVIIVILIILLILYRVRKSRLQATNALLTEPYATPYAREANAGMAPFTSPSGAFFVPTAFDGRPKNINAEIPSQQANVQFTAMPISPTGSNVSQPNASSDATAREEIRLLRERMATLESQLQAGASMPAVEGSRTERRVRSPISIISEAVPTYSED
jgi:hypothetical protein